MVIKLWMKLQMMCVVMVPVHQARKVVCCIGV
jgi:hypothetical protein